MSSAPPLTVTAAGLVCSVGLSAPAACAALRSGLDNFFMTEFVDGLGEPLVGARVPTDLLGEAITPSRGRVDRLARLFVQAARECAYQAGGIDPRRTALCLLGPDSRRPGIDRSLLQHCFEACEAALGRRFHDDSLITQVGSTGLVQALSHTRRLLARRRVAQVLIIGLDSLLNVPDINLLLAQQRLLSQEQRQGLIPGEAAAAVLVTPGATGPALYLQGLGMASEPLTLDNGQASLGQGLAQAAATALSDAGIQAHHLHRRYANLTGEPYFFEEAAYAWMRLLRRSSPDDHRLILPTAQVGEIGSAIGPLMLALELDAQREGYAPGPLALYQFSGAGPSRAALVTRYH